jgi:hypothetical protein
MKNLLFIISVLILSVPSQHDAQSKIIDEFFFNVVISRNESDVISYLSEQRKWTLQTIEGTEEGERYHYGPITLLNRSADVMILISRNKEQLIGYSLILPYKDKEALALLTHDISECLDALTGNRHYTNDTRSSWGQTINEQQQIYALFHFNPAFKENIARLDCFRVSENIKAE